MTFSSDINKSHSLLPVSLGNELLHPSPYNTPCFLRRFSPYGTLEKTAICQEWSLLIPQKLWVEL